MYKRINKLGIDANFLFQDSVDIKITPLSKDADSLAAESQEVAEAYVKAEARERQIVRLTLNLLPKYENKQ